MHLLCTPRGVPFITRMGGNRLGEMAAGSPPPDKGLLQPGEGTEDGHERDQPTEPHAEEEEHELLHRCTSQTKGTVTVAVQKGPRGFPPGPSRTLRQVEEYAIPPGLPIP